MKKVLKKVGIALIVILVGIQFVPANINKKENIKKTDFRFVYNTSKKVIDVFETSCYDCHSNNTNYPWYSNLQPMRYLMDKHVLEGKEELNFSEFGKYSDRMKRNKLRSIKGQVEDDEMPLSSYLLLHPKAKLTEEVKALIINFLDSLN
jgi:hypothetical protein